MTSIRALRQRGIPVVLKTPLMKHTVSGWRQVEELARDLGCASQFDFNITARNDESLRPLDFRVRDESAIAELFSRRFEMLYVHGEPLSARSGPSEDALLCGANATGLAIGPDGSIHPCIGLPLELGVWPKKLADKCLESIEILRRMGRAPPSSHSPMSGLRLRFNLLPLSWRLVHRDGDR